MIIGFRASKREGSSSSPSPTRARLVSIGRCHETQFFFRFYFILLFAAADDCFMEFSSSPRGRESRCNFYCTFLYFSYRSCVRSGAYLLERSVVVCSLEERSLSQFLLLDSSPLFFSPSHISIFLQHSMCSVHHHTLYDGDEKSITFTAVCCLLQESCAEATDASRTPSTALTKRSMKPNRSE